jgi:hypothetical protein
MNERSRKLLDENELNDSAADATEALERLATTDGSGDNLTAATADNKSVDVVTLASPQVDNTLEFKGGDEISPTRDH